jgi:hypothetical protein
MKDELRTELDTLAMSLLKHCESADVVVDAKVDVFKAVATYYLGCNRTKAAKKDDPLEGNFQTIIRKLSPQHDGGTA